MKNRLVFYILCIIAIVFITACNFNVPSKVVIKGSPSFYLPLGNIDPLKIGGFASPNKMFENLGNNIKIYDYHDNTDIQKYLIHYKMAELDLDFNKSISDINLGNDNKDIFVEFDTPSISNSPITKNITIPLTPIFKSIEDGTNTIDYIDLPIVQTESAKSENELGPIDMKFTGFETATFHSGKYRLDFTFDPKDVNSSMKVSINKIVLQNQNGIDLITQNVFWVLSKSNLTDDVIIDLAGEELPKNIKIVLFATITDGGNLEQGLVKLKPSISNISIKDATGITINDVIIPLPDSNINPNIADSFISAIIDTGTLSCTMENTSNTQLYGVNQQVTYNIKQNEGLEIFALTSMGNNSLANKKINKNPLNITGEMKMNASNASFYNMPVSGLEQTIMIAFNIEKFKELLIKSDNLQFEKNISQDLDKNMIDFIEFIRFNESGIKFVFDELISSNQMELSVKSTTLNIDDKKLVEKDKPIDFISKPTYGDSLFVLKPQLTNKIDLYIKVNFTNSGSQILTLQNIIPGQKVSVSCTPAFFSDWKEAKINPGGSGVLSKRYPEGDGIDLSKISKMFNADMEFSSIPVHLYLNSPNNILQSSKISLKFLYDSESKNLIEDADIVEKAVPIFPEHSVFGNKLPESSLTMDNFHEILNKKPNNLYLEYQIKMGSFIIYSNDIKSESSNKITSDLIIEIPLKFNVLNDSEIKLDEMFPNSSKDLFGRDKSSKDNNIDEILKNLDSLTFDIIIKNSKGLTGGLKLKESKFDGMEKNIKFSQPSLTINKNEIERIINDPNKIFSPSVGIEVFKGDFIIPRGFSLTMAITLATNIEGYEIPLRGDK